MATLYTQQDKNVRKTWVLMSVFLIVIVLLGWFISFFYQDPAILYFAVFFSVIMNIGSYWYSDKIVLRLSRARPIEKSENPVLYTIVENLAITAGLPMPALYIIDDPAPNAFATGRDKNHAAVAVTSGLLKMMSRAELEGVLAHELSHVGNRDILISTVVVVLVGFVSILSHMFLRFGGLGGRRREGADGRLGVVLMIVGIVFTILSPLIATLIKLSISRKRESLADASGALLTRYPAGLASALEKIGHYGKRMQVANPAIAHLFIANPFGEDQDDGPNFLEKLFMTHPPIEERVRALRAME